jgi:hypothetical protein
MVEALPRARAVAPRPGTLDYLQAALIALFALGLPIAARLFLPADTAWIGWALHVVPVVVMLALWVEARARGEDPWTILVDVGRRRDPRRWIYAVTDVLFAAGYLYAFEHLIPNRHGWAMMLLELLPLAAWLMAIGTLLARRWTWWLVIAGGAVMLVWTIVTFFVLLYTASYLAGVYGAFGKAASSGVLGAMALIVQFVALLPAFQLKWAMTRAGRRVFGKAPVWRSAGTAG